MARTLALLLLLAAPAHADAVSDDLARAHYKAAQTYFKQGRAEDALHEFREAYRISPRPAFHYNIAICYEKLGKLEDAVASYERYLTEVPDAGDRFAVRERVTELKRRLPVSPPPEEAAPVPPPPAPVVEAPPPESAPPEEELTVRPRRLPQPVWKKGWFWGVVGGGVALVTTVIVVGVVVGTSGGDSPFTLPQVNLR